VSFFRSSSLRSVSGWMPLPSPSVGNRPEKPFPGARLQAVFFLWFFQFIMPVIGWSAGLTISTFIQDYDHWLAFILLAGIGGKMIYDALRDGKEISHSDPTRGLSLLMLSIATSIDALAVGLSLAFLKVQFSIPVS